MSDQWDDTTPIYLQLKEEVVARILEGSLAEGDALPSVRAVATEYRLNPLTVSKAYQALVEEGLVESRRGLGMFVIPGATHSLRDSKRQRFLRDEWPQMVERIKRLGLDTGPLVDQLAAIETAKT